MNLASTKSENEGNISFSSLNKSDVLAGLTQE